MTLPVTSGLILHLDADAITGLSDNDPVAQWEDESGAGNHATQSVATKRPIYKTGVLNSKPVVRFDGSDNELELPSIWNFADPATIIAVTHNVLPITSHAAVIGESGTNFNTKGVIYYRDQANNQIAYSGDRTNNIVDPQVVTVIEGDHVYQNGFKIHEAAHRAAHSRAGRVGRTGNSGIGTLDGDIAEILVYNRALTLNEKHQVEIYLRDKWAIPHLELEFLEVSPASAWSIGRRLRRGYTGPLVRAQRADNAQQDIGTDGNENLDEADLAAFADGQYCDIRTIYGQEGMGFDFTQSLTNRPIIVEEGGSIVRPEAESNRVAVKGNTRGMNQRSGNIRSIFRNVSYGAAFLVANPAADQVGTSRGLYHWSVNASAGPARFGGVTHADDPPEKNILMGVRRLNSDDLATLEETPWEEGLRQHTNIMKWGTGEGVIRRNGQQVASDPSLTTSGNTQDNISDEAQPMGANYKGTWAELVVWNVVMPDAERDAFENDQITFWGVTPPGFDHLDIAGGGLIVAGPASGHYLKLRNAGFERVEGTEGAGSLILGPGRGPVVKG